MLLQSKIQKMKNVLAKVCLTFCKWWRKVSFIVTTKLEVKLKRGLRLRKENRVDSLHVHFLYCFSLLPLHISTLTPSHPHLPCFTLPPHLHSPSLSPSPPMLHPPGHTPSLLSPLHRIPTSPSPSIPLTSPSSHPFNPSHLTSFSLSPSPLSHSNLQHHDS